MSQVDLYQQKITSYYGEEQAWLIRLMDGRDLRVLDIGCGDGMTGKLLKKEGIASHITGIEIVPEAAERAKQNLDVIYQGNVEQMDLPFQAEEFDAMVMTELLEHLVNPWQFLAHIKQYLKPNGFIVASSPNVRHFSVIWKLITATWDYEPSGILDQTHLRFFTKTTFLKLFDSADLSVEVIEPIMNRKYHFVNDMLFGMPEGLITPRYRCRARKSDI